MTTYTNLCTNPRLGDNCLTPCEMCGNEVESGRLVMHCATSLTNRMVCHSCADKIEAGLPRLMAAIHADARREARRRYFTRTAMIFTCAVIAVLYAVPREIWREHRSGIGIALLLAAMAAAWLQDVQIACEQPGGEDE